MKKQMIIISLAILVGFYFGYFFYCQYDRKVELVPAFNPDSYTIYLSQVGAFASKDNMEKEASKFSHYIYEENDGIFYVYLAMTKDMQNASKLKEYFQRNGYDTYIKNSSLINDGFSDILTSYDLVLKQTSSDEVISSLVKQVLTKYEEMVLTDKN